MSRGRTLSPSTSSSTRSPRLPKNLPICSPSGQRLSVAPPRAEYTPQQRVRRCPTTRATLSRDGNMSTHCRRLWRHSARPRARQSIKPNGSAMPTRRMCSPRSAARPTSNCGLSRLTCTRNPIGQTAPAGWHKDHSTSLPCTSRHGQSLANRTRRSGGISRPAARPVYANLTPEPAGYPDNAAAVAPNGRTMRMNCRSRSHIGLWLRR